MKPNIGIVPIIDDDGVLGVYQQYIHAVERAGGIPVIIPYSFDEETLDLYTNACSGFIFVGGVDINPQKYGEEVLPECGRLTPKRDAFDFRMFDRLIKTGKPLLGVCRGMQVFNVALGGTLYQDLGTQFGHGDVSHRHEEPRGFTSHRITIQEDTPLYSLLKKSDSVINSMHHQGIKRLAEGLVPMAYADDGIIEAVYMPGGKYVVAYQWHPEERFDEVEHNRLIIIDFIEHCKE